MGRPRKNPRRWPALPASEPSSLGQWDDPGDLGPPSRGRLDAKAPPDSADGDVQRVGRTLVRQQRWRDAVGQVTKFLKGVLQVATKLLRQGGSLVRRPVGKLPGQPDLHGEGNQMLLRTVVEIALDPPAFRVG